jgi:hypothetical protein
MAEGLWCVLNYLVWHEMYVDKKNYRDYLPQTTKSYTYPSPYSSVSADSHSMFS